MPDAHFEALKLKYREVLEFMRKNGVRIDSVALDSGTLHVRAHAPSLEVEARVWDEIKEIDASYSDLIAEITVAETPRVQTATAGGARGAEELYTVQPGDTLRAIAESYYGDPDRYLRIFEANRESMRNADDLRPGQRLLIPLES